MSAFPSDDDLFNSTTHKTSHLPAKVILEKIVGDNATYQVDQKTYPVKLQLRGIYNAYNAAGAVALVSAILPEVKCYNIFTSLSEVKSAFGRGETFTVNDLTVELLLVKNPSAFQLSLESFADQKHDFLIAINDNIADGRDVSWLWNVDFTPLKHVAVTSGIRASDMALRLKYDEIAVDKIIPQLEPAVRHFIANSDRPKRIFATYTAMLAIRKILTGKSLI